MCGLAREVKSGPSGLVPLETTYLWVIYFGSVQQDKHLLYSSFLVGVPEGTTVLLGRRRHIGSSVVEEKRRWNYSLLLSFPKRMFFDDIRTLFINCQHASRAVEFYVPVDVSYEERFCQAVQESCYHGDDVVGDIVLFGSERRDRQEQRRCEEITAQCTVRDMIRKAYEHYPLETVFNCQSLCGMSWFEARGLLKVGVIP